MKPAALGAAALAALVLSAASSAASLSTLHLRQQRQAATIHRYRGTERFFRNHPRLARTRVGRRALRFARQEIARTRRELRRTLAALRRARYPEPSWWLGQAACIRSHEGTWTDNTGNGYYGSYQFLLSTWRSVGGRGYPYEASPTEQTFRAWLVWKRDGGSWREWGTAGACGLT